jgi:hypothetical protein
VEYRISIVDDSGTSILTAEMVLDDDNNDGLVSLYDEVTEQHVITGIYDGFVRFEIPAFTAGDVNYHSAAITISDSTDEVLNISSSGTNDNFFLSDTKS